MPGHHRVARPQPGRPACPTYGTSARALAQDRSGARCPATSSSPCRRWRPRPAAGSAPLSAARAARAVPSCLDLVGQRVEVGLGRVEPRGHLGVALGGQLESGRRRPGGVVERGDQPGGAERDDHDDRKPDDGAEDRPQRVMPAARRAAARRRPGRAAGPGGSRARPPSGAARSRSATGSGRAGRCCRA